MTTAQDMYRYFLDILRKERTAIIPPDFWNRYINEQVVDWVKTKLPDGEFNQKRIDDLESLRVITNGVIDDKIAVTTTNDNYYFLIPDDPKYMHGLNMSFDFRVPIADSNVGTGTGTGTGGELDSVPSTDTHYVINRGARILRSDQKVFLNKNPYRSVSDENIYFDVIKGIVYTYAPVLYEPYKMIIEYYKSPDEIKFDPDNNINTTLEFPRNQNKEIADWAISMYLERVSASRLQTFPIMESQIPK